MTEPAAPPPSTGSAVAEPPIPPASAAEPPSRAVPRARRTRLVIAIVISVVLLIVLSLVAYELFVPGPASVHVQSIVVWTPDDVCGLETNLIGYHGYNTTVKSEVSVEIQVPNFNASKCVVHTVTTNSSGFSLSDLHLPWEIPASGSNTTHVTIQSPGSAFSGDVNLILE